MAKNKEYRIFLVAGEPSGDLLGGRLMDALKAQCPKSLRFQGIGGEQMEARGLKSLFPLADLTLFGIAEIIPHIPKLLRRLRETRAAIEAFNPHAIITIDAPGFCFRLIKRLKSHEALRIHYTAPQVWAWAPWRAKKVARIFDSVLTLFPFEPAYFTSVGLPATFVGHSLIEAPLPPADGEFFRQAHNIPASAPLLGLLPGSRQSEVRTLLPLFKEAALNLRQRYPGLHIIIPLVPSVAPYVRENLSTWDCPYTLIEKSEDKLSAMAACSAALTASGTVTLELARARVPFVVAYKIHPLTAWLARHLIRVSHIALVNILAGREVVPELLQNACTPEAITKALLPLFENPLIAQKQKDAFQSIIARLESPDRSLPSHAAARAILKMIKERS